MPSEHILEELQRHVAAALGVLSHAVDRLAGDRAAFLADQPAMRVRMGEALGAYRHFKHARVFDPGIASGDPARAAAARAVKVACIGADETFRGHMRDWPRERIEREWDAYRVAARLTANSLSRHIRNEGEAIEALIRRYGA